MHVYINGNAFYSTVFFRTPVSTSNESKTVIKCAHIGLVYFDDPQLVPLLTTVNLVYPSRLFCLQLLYSLIMQASLMPLFLL